MCLDLNFPTFRMYHKVVKPKTGLLGGLLGGVVSLVLGIARGRRHPRRGRLPRGRQADVDRDDATSTVDEGLSAGNGWRLFDPIDLKPELGGAAARRPPGRAALHGPRRREQGERPRSTTSTSTRCAGSLLDVAE